MAKQVSAPVKEPGIFARLQDFFDSVIAELKKVTWPTREDLMASTKVTLFIIAIMAGVVFVYDRVFSIFIMLILKLAA
ncbi:MAG TPA: preprotein translocase subunit SecE [Candidatus Hydrogenedentes bacterium]|nr:MAG: preprotein translocase subunit SecE [Candidatus Hydrogenedentes bacterium ADurb.Bin170]HNZ49194.1 preprotein translocase subunit SecE [Candidatus Hydrogenedentota bacterium]HOD96354.1 preprotein translocase subunit SecE [Candidatus Hydrogenedentota bacterium]HOH43727.1 preprotein translocase subunit SecE [Candidatus Hydrogenedentota bacterium]HOM49469.1 preprotein translocase subunit SecE [Candidatus Hydrogenedentota bacterium]